MIARALVSTVAVGVLCVATIPAAGADPAASRVIDRTFVCGVKVRAGARILTARAWSGFRDPAQPSRWLFLPFVQVADVDFRAFASTWAGAPAPPGRYGERPISHWLLADPAPCNPTTMSVRMSASGLDGGVASQLQYSDEYGCSAPERVLVRVRAVFRSPVTLAVRRLGTSRYFASSAGVPVESATTVVATPKGQRLVYASVAEAGRATLFTARGCAPR